MKRIKLWLAVVLTGLVTVVVLQNTEPVTTQFLFTSFEMPRAGLLATVFGLGVLTGFLLRLKAAARPKA